MSFGLTANGVCGKMISAQQPRSINMDRKQQLNDILKSMKMDGEVINYTHVTPYARYWVKLGPDGSLKKLENKATEIGLAMRSSAPICTPDWETGAVCLEMMEGDHPLIRFDDLVQSSGFHDPQNVLSKYELPILLGTKNVNEPLIVDLATFPHVLLAGTTGSGKSVCMHAMYKSLDLHAGVNQVKFVLIDPKFVEFTAYRKSKRLMYDIATEPDAVESVLANLTDEMDKRLKILHKNGCRDLAEYRRKTNKGSYIVVFIDEVSDLMQTTKKRFEDSLCRLAQKARAAGIHIVAATQYPHSNVITGKVKANFDGRICFRVTDAAHSRVMLGEKNSGAVHLEGKGDGYISGGGQSMQRFRGALVDMARPKPGLFSRVSSALSSTIS